MRLPSDSAPHRDGEPHPVKWTPRTNSCALSPVLPRHLWLLLAIYFLATVSHFAHNAEFIAYYPNTPGWLSREYVYLAWLGMTSVGIAGLAATRVGLQALGAAIIGAYGALGLDALAHYTVALCSEHTLAANFTIWFEAATGVALLFAAARFAGRTLAQRPDAIR